MYPPGCPLSVSPIHRCKLHEYTGRSLLKQLDVSSYECLHVYYLHTYLPTAVIALTLLYDTTLAFGVPKNLRDVLDYLATPFRNFLKIEDLDEAFATKTRIRQPQWKLNILVALPLVQALLDITLLTYLMAQERHADAMRHLLLALSWVK